LEKESLQNYLKDCFIILQFRSFNDLLIFEDRTTGEDWRFTDFQLPHKVCRQATKKNCSHV